MTKTYKCPTCDGYIPTNEHIGAYPGAISRRDNKTEICSACGVKEAFDDLLRGTCNCKNLDDNLIEEGWTCYECYQEA